MLHQLKNSKKMNKNEKKTESLMIKNVPELVEAVRRELVVRRLQQR
jgi:hypothetical protein